MHAQVLWGRELWNKSDIQVEMMWTNDLYKAVCKHMQNHREKDLKAEMTQVHQGNGKDVQMIVHKLQDIALWTGKSPGLKKMHSMHIILFVISAISHAACVWLH